MNTDELIENALNTIGPNSVPESAGMVYALIAIALELKRANDLKTGELEADEIWQAWDKTS